MTQEEDWGVFQFLGFFALAVVVFKVMIRLKELWVLRLGCDHL